MDSIVDDHVGNTAQYQVKFFTKLEKYVVPSTPFSIPSNVGVSNLSSLVNKLLSDNSTEHISTEFDFLIASKFLRSELGIHIEKNNISVEDVLEIEYIEKYRSPEPDNSLDHDDWVSAVHANQEWIVSGCYDNTVHLWSLTGDHKLTIPGHTGPVKGISWIKCENDTWSFVSVSQDQTAMLWKWNQRKNSVECVNVCKGHARSVECVSVNPSRSCFATGSWDKMLKIWSVESNENEEDGEQVTKRQKLEVGSGKTKTPIMTLSGHHECVSSIQWTTDHEVCTASWDHTIRLWDVELGGLKSQLSGSKAFFDISYSKLSGHILSASADRHVRLWDPRIKDGTMMKCNFTSHTGWISCVHWSPNDEHRFVSGSHDNLIKLWDTRSPNSPLYDMTGHSDKVMCVDWTVPVRVISGAADNTLKIYKTS